MHYTNRYRKILVKDSQGLCNHKIYSHTRSLPRHTSFPNPMVLGPEEATCSLNKAELFNKFFHSVLTPSMVHTLQPSCNNPGPPSTLQLDPLETLKALESRLI